MNSFAASENGLMWLVGLFRDANLPVQIVMVLLLLASIWTWAIIVSHWAKMRRIARENDRFEREFWKSEDIDHFYEARGRSELPSARVLAAGIAEWRRSTHGRALDKDGTRARLAVAAPHSMMVPTLSRQPRRPAFRQSAASWFGRSIIDHYQTCRIQVAGFYRYFESDRPFRK